MVKYNAYRYVHMYILYILKQHIVQETRYFVITPTVIDL